MPTGEPDRLERLERRVAALESELRRLRGAEAPEPERTPAEPSAARAPEPTAPSTSPVVPATDPPTAPSRPPPARRARRPAATRDLEQWLGRNALVVVGALSLVAAAAFLLKHAFDQGWISPGLRVAGGLLGGVALAAWGERLQRRGLAAYGGALVGAGGAIAYLAVWAAAGPYALVPAWMGVLGLALLSALVVVSAVVSDVALLASLAGAGAFFAPLLLRPGASSPDVLLLYAGLIAAGVGGAAAVKGWRSAFAIAVLGGLFLPTAGPIGAAEVALAAPYLALGGAAAVEVCRSRRWRWLRPLAFLLAWALLAVVASSAEGWRAWVVFLVLPALALPALVHHLRRRGAPGPLDRSPAVELSYLWASAAAWGWTAWLAGPSPLDSAPLLLLGLVALPYLAIGVARRLPAPLVIGVGLLAAGTVGQLQGLGITAGLAGLALVTAFLARPARLAPARWAALALVVAAGVRLIQVDLAARAAGDLAFVGPWALVLYLLVAAAALSAGPLWGASPPAESSPPASGAPASGDPLAGLRSALWLAAGTVLLAGVTQEIAYIFRQGPGRDLAEGALLGDLAVSAWWLLFAGALIALGFWRDRRSVRLGGLAVTALALLKVVFQDFTRLDALYRVASFGLLALLALAAAYLYHRRSGSRRATDAASP